MRNNDFAQLMAYIPACIHNMLKIVALLRAQSSVLVLHNTSEIRDSVCLCKLSIADLPVWLCSLSCPWTR